MDRLQVSLADPEREALAKMPNDRLEQIAQKYIYPIPSIMSRIGSYVLFLMMFLTVADVFLRKVFAKSILGTVEITEFMMVILVFFGLAQAEVEDGNVRVDIVMQRFSERGQLIIEMVTQFCCFLLFVFMTWYSFTYAGSKVGSGEVSQDLWIPVYPFVYLVALGFAVLTMVLGTKCIIALIKIVRR